MTFSDADALVSELAFDVLNGNPGGEKLTGERVAQILQPDRAEIGALADAPPRPLSEGVVVDPVQDARRDARLPSLTVELCESIPEPQ